MRSLGNGEAGSVTAQGRSKWLHDEGDGYWGTKHGNDNNLGFQIPSFKQVGNQGRKEGIRVVGNTNNSGGLNQGANLVHDLEGNNFSNFYSGSGSDELDGLNLKERERRRSGPSESMDTKGLNNSTQSDSGFQN